jgi:hypothetical protein
MPNAEQSAWQNDAPSPFTNNLIPSLSSQSSTPRAPRGDDDKPNSPAEWIEVFAEQHGVDVDHRSFHDRKKFFPLAKAWTNAGITVGQMRAACAKAQSEAKEPIAWLPAYADRVLATMQAQRQPAAAESFAEREQRMHRENWEQMTGRQWPDAPTASLTSADAVDCIDVESTPARIAQ